MREERKVVTALFADVVGSTAITERLDPEDARELIGDAVRTMVEAVERFGGTVKDLAGDGVLALFGAPVAHEDDAERAVRAALEIVRALGGGDEPSSLSARVGIESGLVVLGPVGAGTRVEYGATGNALNVAARLQSHAPPGGILVGAVTQRGIRDVFAWGDERRLELKGKAEPVSAFEVVGVRDRTDRRRNDRGAPAPLVGRGDELARATALARRALGGRGGLLLVLGEPGIGKSRLVDEVRRELERDGSARWLEGRCVSFGQSTPFLPLREPILDALDVPPDELHARLPDLAGEDATYLEAILGVAGEVGAPRVSPETLQFRTLEALRSLLARLAEARPVVVAVEDVHWADPSTLHVVERLVAAMAGSPVLFVLTARDREGPTERLARLAASLPEDAREVIELRELAPGVDDDLLAALLGGRTLPADLRRRVVETSGGNPFFLGELARSLIDSGIAEREASAVAGVAVELPTTVEKVILARLDALEPAPREILTAASVLGGDAPAPLLARLVETDPRPAVDELCRMELLDRGDRPDELVFRHALIREVAYGTLLKRRRRELHARAAAAIAELWPDRLEEQLGVLAYHHRGAGEIDSARECHARAAERAERLHAVEEALDHLTSAIALADELGRGDAERDVAELRLARARVRARTGDVTGATDDLERVLAAGGPPEVAMRAHDELGFVLAGAADYRAAVPHLTAALDAAVALEDGVAQVSALSRLAIVQTNRLDLDAGLEYGARALAIAEALGDEHAIAVAMDGLKQVALQTGDFETLERLADRLAEIHRRNDDLWLLQFVLLEVAYADIARARLDRAVARLEESLDMNRRIGDLGNEPAHVTVLGVVHRAKGEYGTALALGRRAFEQACDLDHPEWIAWSAAWLGGTALEVGALDEASRVLDAGIVAGERSAADLHLVRCLGLHAWASYRLGDRERGVELADRATAIFERIRVRPPRAYVPGRDAYAAVARVRLREGFVKAATALIAPVVAACEACGWSDGIVEGGLVLAEAALRSGDPPGAAAVAERALAEGLRSGSPLTWQAHAAVADACRAVGDEVRAADHVRRAEALVAALAETLDDGPVRAAFEARAVERLSGDGRRG
jgi:class 3 adenylate cyclase/tetratricopeptide (TPR) repeat protein